MDDNFLLQFSEDGYVFIERLFFADQVAAVADEVPRLSKVDDRSVVFEADSSVVRGLHGGHLVSEACASLARDPKIAGLAKQILGSDVYIYQFKINVKSAFDGSVWPWHQDFIYWNKEDGMPRPSAVTVAVYLDDVTEFNGPLYLLAGSHKHGMLDFGATQEKSEQADGAENDWLQNVSASLKYQVPKETVSEIARTSKLVSTTGPAGSCLVFDSNIVHASSPNISPFNRRIAFITYNSVTNIPTKTDNLRPEFLVTHDISQALIAV